MRTYTSQIQQGKNLSAKEAEMAFSELLQGIPREYEVIDFLLALKEKGETSDEILGAARVFKNRGKKVDLGDDVIDVCGTGGDNLGTLNVSTAVAIVAAGAGAKIAKHGNKSVSSKSGSADVLTELGINIHSAPEKQMETSGMCFLFAPDFHPAVKIVADLRKKMNTRTIFNILGPLLNPAEANLQLVGVYSPHLLRTFAEVLRDLGTKKAWIVHGLDGLDEISISGETQVAELDNGSIDIFTITPQDAGLNTYPLEQIKGGDAKQNAQAIEKLLNGEKGAYREIVLLNAAAALLLGGKAQSLEDGAKLAADSIDSGRALNVLSELRKISA